MASELETLSEETGPLATQLAELEGLADSFGGAMTTAFRNSVVEGKRLEDVLRSLALSLSSRALNAALAPISQGIVGAIGGVFGGGAAEGAFSRRSVGGMEARPLGAAPPEGAGRASAHSGVNVTFNINTADAESFRRSEAEVTAMLARAVARGRRGL